MSHHIFRNCQFYTSVNQFNQLPDDEIIEVAFAGRSNAGKSSAINVICDIKNLCRTSKTPGRTQMINYFHLPQENTQHTEPPMSENNMLEEHLSQDMRGQAFLVDLPGYGYAKVPPKVKQHWQKLLERYLSQRQSLQGVVMIMDIRHPLTDYDKTMLNWCSAAKMPTHILLTKMDKLKFGAAKNALLKTQKQLKSSYPYATIQLFSALNKNGVEEARDILNQWLFTPPSG